MSLDTAVIMVLEILNSITILVLLALGLALIFGMMRIVNLAQGEFFTAGGVTGLAARPAAPPPPGGGAVVCPPAVRAVGPALRRVIIPQLFARALARHVAPRGG